MTSVSGSARDITFEFNNSCNGCCPCCDVPEDKTTVFVKKDGTAERFSTFRTVAREEANRIAIENLRKRLELIAGEIEHSPSEAVKYVEEKAAVDLSPRKTKDGISLSQLKRINTAVKSLRAESAEKSTGSGAGALASPVKFEAVSIKMEDESSAPSTDSSEEEMETRKHVHFETEKDSPVPASKEAPPKEELSKPSDKEASEKSAYSLCTIC